MRIPTAVVNARGEIVVANPAFCQALGSAPTVIAGSALSDWVPLTTGAVVDVHTCDRQRRRAELSISPIGGGDVLVHLVDIEQQCQLIDHLTTLTTTDALTGLLNRRGVLDRIDSHLATCRRTEVRGGALLIDLDRLKPINDRHGHQVGDLVIAAVAEAIAQPLGGSDAAGRIGGDEFAVLIGGGSGEDVSTMARSITESVSISTAGLADRIGAPITVSIGAAAVGRTHRDATALLDEADRAMYRCKVHHITGAA